LSGPDSLPAVAGYQVLPEVLERIGLHYSISESVGWRDEKETVVIVDLKAGQVSMLENAARLLWLAIAEGREEGDMAERVSLHYDIPKAEAEAHVREFIAELVQEGWIAGTSLPEM
jgi:hypothetical protein